MEPERASPPRSGGASDARPQGRAARPEHVSVKANGAQGRAEGKAARPRRRGARAGGQGAQRRAGGLPPEPPCASMGLFFADAKYNRLDLTFL